MVPPFRADHVGSLLRPAALHAARAGREAGRIPAEELTAAYAAEVAALYRPKRRIDEAAKYVDGDRLCLSGQCGFASTVEGNSLTIEQERAKLDLIVSVVAEIWG